MRRLPEWVSRQAVPHPLGCMCCRERARVAYFCRCGHFCTLCFGRDVTSQCCLCFWRGRMDKYKEGYEGRCPDCTLRGRFV